MENNIYYGDIELIFRSFDLSMDIPLFVYEPNFELLSVVRQCDEYLWPRPPCRTYEYGFVDLCNVKANSAVQVAPVNPRPFLQELTGKMVAVKLKWGLEYRGFLVATDAYMNLQVRFLELFSYFLVDQG